MKWFFTAKWWLRCTMVIVMLETMQWVMHVLGANYQEIVQSLIPVCAALIATVEVRRSTSYYDEEEATP